MEDDQQFCLRWNNHQATLISVFDKLLEKGIHVDCTLAAEGQTLKAHKVVLSACSPYFESVLSQQYDKHPIIILKDVKYAELRAMMDYMYRGEVNISQDQLAALLKAAESLQIKGLSDNKPSPPPAQNSSPPKQQCESLSGETEDEEESLSCASSSVSGRKRLKRSDSPNILTSENNNLPPAASSPVPTLTPSAPQNGRHDTDDPPSTSTINDVVQNFQWHMERNAQEDLTPDGQRDSQGVSADITTPAEPTQTSELKLRPRTRALNATDVVTKNNGCGDEVSFTRIGGLTWEQWSARLALPLVASMRVSSPGAAGDGFACPDCGRFYKLKSSLRNHQKWECGKEPQFQCPYCVYRAKQKMHIARHMERMHREKVYGKTEPPFIKADNIDAFAHLSGVYGPYLLGYGTTSIKSEGYIKTGWTLYECVDCGNKYKHKGSLQRHIKYECRKQPSFKCPYCVYRAYQKHNLLLHERHLHKDLPEKVDFISE